jgi:LysM repeat protein
MRAGARFLIAGLSIAAAVALAGCGGSTATPLPSLAPDTPAPSLPPVVETLAPATEIPATSDAPADTSAPSTTAVYKVKKGDTLSGIAAKYGITLKALLKLNPKLKSPYTLHVGQKIVVPAK